MLNAGLVYLVERVKKHREEGDSDRPRKHKPDKADLSVRSVQFSEQILWELFLSAIRYLLYIA